MKKQLLILCALLSAGVSSGVVHAKANIDTLNALAQSQFNTLSKDFGSALSYKSFSAAEPSGVTGFSIGVDATLTQINKFVWRAASGGSNIDSVVLPRLSVSKGLPLSFDVEGFYTAVPNSNITLWGGAVKYSLLEGTVATPALAIRGNYTSLNGIDQLDFTSTGVDVLVSKGLLNFTPYAGIGQVWSTMTPKGVAATAGLTETNTSQTKFFMGMNTSLLLLKIGLYFDKTGEENTTGVRFALGL